MAKTFHRPVAPRSRIHGCAPDELSVWLVLRKAPPAPFVPAEWHDKEVLVIALCYSGPMAAGEAAAAPFRALGKPIADLVGPHPFVSWQAAFDPLLTPGARNYWKSHDFKQLTDTTSDVLLDAVWRLPSSECEVFVGHLGSQINRVSTEATAFPRRDVEFHTTRWCDPAQDTACIDWARNLFQALAPHAMGCTDQHYSSFFSWPNVNSLTAIPLFRCILI